MMVLANVLQVGHFPLTKALSVFRPAGESWDICLVSQLVAVMTLIAFDEGRVENAHACR